MQTKLRDFGIAMATVVTSLYHYFAPDNQSASYAVWCEYAGSDLLGDNSHTESGMGIDFDFFTKTEFDAVIDNIETKFDALGVYWELSSIQYERETGFIHYHWSVYIG